MTNSDKDEGMRKTGRKQDKKRYNHNFKVRQKAKKTGHHERSETKKRQETKMKNNVTKNRTIPNQTKPNQ